MTDEQLEERFGLATTIAADVFNVFQKASLSRDETYDGRLVVLGLFLGIQLVAQTMPENKPTKLKTALDAVDALCQELIGVIRFRDDLRKKP